jgi:hypothetical protein
MDASVMSRQINLSQTATALFSHESLTGDVRAGCSCREPSRLTFELKQPERKGFERDRMKEVQLYPHLVLEKLDHNVLLCIALATVVIPVTHSLLQRYVFSVCSKAQYAL